MSEADAEWPSGWLRSTLRLATVAVLTTEPMHGYAVAQSLAAHGLGTVRGSVLYPALGKLETEGAIVGTWEPGDSGPGRKVYSVTELGHARLRDERRQWRGFATAIDDLLDSSREERP